MDRHNLKWKLLGSILGLIFLFPSIASASVKSNEVSSPLRIMAPAPHMLEKAKNQNELGNITAMYSKIREKNKKDNVKSLPPGGAGMRRSVSVVEKSSTPVKPTAKALAIAVQYTDKKATTKISYFQNLLFGDAFGSMRDYYRTVSNNNFVMEGKVVGTSQDTVFITLPHTKNYYADNSSGGGSYPQNAQGLVADAVQALIAANFDWTPYKGADGVVPYLFVIHAGVGGESTNDQTDMWSCRWSLNEYKITTGNTTINDFTLEPELTADWSGKFVSSTMGVYAHEFGHNLGLPDLYDTNPDYISEGVGNWSIMGSGSWAGPDMMGEVPVEFDGWSKAFLGWTTPEVVPEGTNTETIPRIEGTSGKVLRLNSPNSDEYFLIENRQKTSYDKYMDGSGLLIWHIDSSIADPNSTYWQNNTVNSSGDDSPPHRGVYVIEADGKNELDSSGNRGDAGDPFPGSTNVRTVKGSSKTTPNLRTWDGQDSNLSITAISDSLAEMTSTFTVGNSGIVQHELSGKVTDPTGKAVKAKVVVKNVASTSQYDTTTDDIGVFSFDNIPAGSYSIEASYSTSIYSNSIAQTVQLDPSTSQTVTLKLRVKPVISTLKTDPTSLNLVIDDEKAILLNATYTDGSQMDVSSGALWKSSNNKIVTVLVDKVTGIVNIKALAKGRATITASLEGKKVSIPVKITPEVVGLKTEQANVSLQVGKTQGVKVKVIYKDGSTQEVTKTIQWQSVDEAVAKMTITTIKGIGIGETTIIGKYNENFSISINVKVTLPVKKLTGNPTTLNLVTGEQEMINLTTIYTNNSNEMVTKNAGWSSRNDKIAKVENGGVVTAVSKGSTMITATFSGRRTSIPIKVAPMKSLT